MHLSALAECVNERQFIGRYASAVLLDLWIAGGAFVAFMVVVDGPDAYERFTVPSLWWAIYFGFGPLCVALWLRHRMRPWAAARDAPRALRSLLVDVPCALVGYVVGAAVLVVWDAGFLGGQMTSGVLQVVIGVTLTLFAYCGIPLFLVLQMLMGRYFGPGMLPRPLVPAIWRLLAAVLGITFVGSTSFLLQVSVRTGQIDWDSALIWLMLIAYAGAVSAVAYRSYAASVAPLQQVMARMASPAEAAQQPIVAQSLDEIGAMAVQLNELFTQQTAIQRSMRDSEVRFRMFAESASDYFYELDDQLRFSYFSERFDDIVGVRAAEVIGLTSQAMAAKFGVQNYGSHQLDLEQHRPFRDYRFAARRPDGRIVHLQVSGVPYFDEHGRFRGYRGSGANITPMVDAQETLRVREAELAQAQKMEAVGQLTGGIAHDFNNLLTVILGNLELLQVIARDRDDHAAYTQAAVAAAKRGGALTQRLLAFSRRQSLSPENVDLGALLESTVDLLRRALGEDVEVTVEVVSQPLWPCRADRHQLENVVLNLALNARDAMPKGGELRLELSNHRILESSLDRAAGDYVLMRITDSGEGIAPDALPHVFEPFFTTKPPGEGSGLGLSMVYGFVKQSGGDVRVESKVGRGTVVQVWLPRAAEAASVAARGLLSAHARDGEGQTILVIEDDPGVAAVVTEALTGVGYGVVIAVDGADALARLDSLPRVDLLLTDVVLPGEHSGIEVADLVRVRRPATKVLFMSGYALDEIQRRAGTELDLDILKKPFQLAELADHVSRKLGAD